VELLLDNLKNVLFKGKHAKSGLEVIPDKSLILRIIVVGCISLLMGRAALCYSLEPCALALMTALMTRSKANIYALPMICLGIISASWTSFHYFGDVFTLILCSLIYLVIGTKKLNLIFRALISAVTMVSVKTIYYLWTGLFFLYDSLTAALDILILFTFIYVFWKFFRLIEKGIQKESAVEILAIVSVIIMVATSGIGVVQLGPVSLLHIVALFITLLIGHNIGPSEGALVGIINGLFTMFAALDTPAFIGILGCSGMVAGIFKGQRRIISGICFGGIALAFGSIKGFPDLYLSIYEPVIAAGIYILIPKPVIERIGKLFSFIQQDDSYYESLAKKRVGEQLREYQNLFQKLALTSGTMGTFNPARDIVTQQFKGMAVALKKMSESMAEKNEPIIPKKPRYKVQLGVAGYAKEGKAQRHRCPFNHYGVSCSESATCQLPKTIRVPLSTDVRIFTEVGRTQYQWKRIYASRTAVERVNSRLDVSFGFEIRRVRGKDKMELFATIAFAVMNALAVGSIKENRPERMRSLIRAS
jgi:hypothetical protein